jgi:hypothetical protein
MPGVVRPASEGVSRHCAARSAGRGDGNSPADPRALVRGFKPTRPHQAEIELILLQVRGQKDNGHHQGIR